MLGLFWMSSLGLAQEQAVPSIRILPKDVVQGSIRQLHMTTNKFTVRYGDSGHGAAHNRQLPSRTHSRAKPETSPLPPRALREDSDPL